MSDDNIDKIAFIFFSALTFCALMNDSYSLVHNFFKNDYVKKKMNNMNKIKKVFFGLLFNNYKNDEDGNIIIEEEDLVKNTNLKNPFEDDENDEDDYDIVDDEDIVNMYVNENKIDTVEELKLETNKNNLKDEDLLEEISNKDLLQENSNNELKISSIDNIKIEKDKLNNQEVIAEKETLNNKEIAEVEEVEEKKEKINNDQYEKNISYDDITILKTTKKNKKDDKKDDKKKKEKIIKEIIIKKPNKIKKDEN